MLAVCMFNPVDAINCRRKPMQEEGGKQESKKWVQLNKHATPRLVEAC